MNKNLMAIDIGAGSGRVFTSSYDGKKLSLFENYRFHHKPVRIGDEIYLDFLRIWDFVKIGMKTAAEAAGKIDAMGIDSFAPDFCLFDSRGTLLCNALSYRTMLGSGILDKIYGKVPPRVMYDYAGIQGNEILLLPQILHLIEKNRGWLLKKSTILPLTNAIEYLLTGEMSMDFTVASVSMLWDGKKKEFSKQLVKDFLGSVDYMPEVAANQSIKGKIGSNDEWVEMNGVPVINSGAHDTALAAYTLEFAAKGQICINCGTWSSISVVVDDPIKNDTAYDSGLTNYGLPNGKYMFGTVMPGLYYLQECKAEWERSGQSYGYEELTRLGMEAEGFEMDLDDEVLSETEKSVLWRINQYFIRRNEKPPETIGEYTHCIIRSLVLKYDKIIDALEISMGYKFSAIYMGGGGVKSDLLCDLIKRITKKDLICIASEVTIAGNFLSQLISLNEISENDAEEVLRTMF